MTYTIEIIIKSTDKASAGMRGVAGEMEKVGKTLSGAGMTMMKLTAPIAAIGAVSLKTAIDFDKAMRNVNAIAQLSEDQFESLRQKTIDFSLITRASAEDVANSLYNVVSAGYDAERAFEVMKVAASAAGAGNATAADTTRLLIAALRSYNLEVDQADRVTDIFLQTVNEGITTLPELASGLGRVLPLASNLGVTLEEVGFVMARMTQTGLSTDEAVTRLQATFTGLLNPSKELKSAINALGFETGYQLVQHAGGAIGALKLLKEAGFLDSTDAAGDMFNNVRALGGVLSILGNDATLAGGAIEEFGKRAEGARERAKEEQYKSLDAQLKILKSAFEAISIQIGTDFLPALTEITQELIPVIRELGQMDEGTRKAIVGFGLLAVATSTTVLVLGKVVTAAGAVWAVLIKIPAIIAAIATGFKAWSAGMTLTTALGAAGLSPIAITLGAIALAVGSVIAVWVKWNKLMETTKEGRQQVSDSWSEFFQEQVASGKNATQIVEEYRAAQERVQGALEEGGLVAKLFIRNQDELVNATAQVNAALLKVSTSYEEYRQAAIDAGLSTEIWTREQFESTRAALEAVEAAGELGEEMDEYTRAALEAVEAQLGLADATGELVAKLLDVQDIASIVKDQLGKIGKGSFDATGVMNKLGTQLGLVSDEQLALEQGLRVVTDAMGLGLITWEQYAGYIDQVREGALQLSERELSVLAWKVADLQKNMMAANDISSIAADQLNKLGLGSDTASVMMERLNLKLGLTSKEQLELDRTLRLLTDAMGLGVITGLQYEGFVDQLQDGTLRLSQAQLDAIASQVDYQKALQDSARAAQDFALAQLGLAQSLKGATDAQIAQAAISELDKAFKDGKLSFEDYVAAVGGIQESFGLSDEKSRALSEGLLLVRDALLEGKVPAEDFDKILKDLIQDAKDGVVDYDNLFGKWGELPDALKPGQDAMQDTIEDLGDLLEGAETTVAGMEAAFQAPDWAGLGTDITGGIARGITAGTPAIESAASAAAQAAIDAARKKLDSRSPSRVGIDIGQDFDAGIGLGIERDIKVVTASVQTLMDATLGALDGFRAEIPLQIAMDTALAASRAGSTAANILQRQTIDPLKEQLGAIDRLMRPGHIDLMAMEKRVELERRRAEMAEKIVRAETRVLELQKQQDRLNLLQSQLRLLDLIREHKLDAGEILQGLMIGQADMGQVVEAMARAISTMVDRAEAELGISSPSRKAEWMMHMYWAGMIRGIESGVPKVQMAMAGALNTILPRPADISLPGLQAASYVQNPYDNRLPYNQAGTVIHKVEVNVPLRSINSLIDVESLAYEVADVIGRRNR